MSGLLERIVRRRRSTTSSRIGVFGAPGEPDRPLDDVPANPELNGVGASGGTAGTRTGEFAAADRPTTRSPGFIERGRIRRRARYLRQLREIQLRDLGGFLVELQRFGRARPDLVEAKIAGAALTDSELRSLEHALGWRPALREIREPGIGGACSSCGAIYGSTDHFCACCGEPLELRPELPEAPADDPDPAAEPHRRPAHEPRG